MDKVILIGIDGATPDLINNWIDKGYLKNFKKLKDNGVWGKLKSTTPPFSAPAWTSIITGCQPGKHGIYGFESTGTLNPHLINSKYRKRGAIWNYLSKIGKKNIIVNVPGSYPPEKINGFMITGLLSPSEKSNFTYPSNLKNRLNDKDLGNYKLEQLWLEDFSRSRMKKRSPEKLLNNIIKQMISREKVTINLMAETDWDFTMIVFRGTDTAQHFLFDRSDLLLDCYKVVDKLIGDIIEKFPNATAFIISDHGFESIKNIFYPDNLLYNEGYLKPSQDPYENLHSFYNLLFYKFFTKIINILPVKFLKDSNIIKKFIFSSSSKSKLIDFTKTKAFSTADGRGIQICRNDLYKNGIVKKEEYYETIEEIISLLKNLKDENDNPIIEKVYRSIDIYGESAFNPPDIVIDLKKGITASEWIKFPEKTIEIIRNKNKKIPLMVEKDPSGRSGDHSQYGIFYAFGDKIRKNYEIKNLRVEDVMPNIFFAMGLSSPEDIDGKIMHKIFKEILKVKQIEWDLEKSKKPSLSKSEYKKINMLKRKTKKI
jgi:predicted AlkP superfamily phosphohydrolase/phosphomutase